jgi:glycosyltransferase domain-containing protein
LNYLFLDKLTIVIFTYNRHKLLKRAIKYWSNYNLKILILDGSDIKLNDSVLENKNLRYIHKSTSLYDRLLSSIKYIDTEFMILCADDEFYLPSALSSCVQFLVKEPSFSSCGGPAIGFGFSKNRLYGLKAYPKLNGFCLDDRYAIERATKHFTNYVPAHFYSVMRFFNWKKISLYVFQKRYLFGAAHELQVEFLSTICGKSKIIPQLMWMRNKEVSSITQDIIKLDISKWWQEKKYENERLDFLKRMKRACNELLSNNETKLNEDTISKIFQTCIKTRSKNVSFVGKIKKLISDDIKRLRIIKFILLIKNKFIISNHKSLKYEISLLESQGIRVNHKDLNKIISIIKS